MRCEGQPTLSALKVAELWPVRRDQGPGKEESVCRLHSEYEEFTPKTQGQMLKQEMKGARFLVLLEETGPSV